MAQRVKSATVFEDKSFPLSCRRHESHGPARPHSHEFHELVVILAGRGRHLTDVETHDIAAGDVFVIRGDMVHGYADTDQMTLVNILYNPRPLGLPLAELRDVPGYHALFRVEPRLRAAGRFRNRMRLSEEELAEASGMIYRLQEEMERKRPGYRFMACVHLMNLIGFLSRCYSRELQPSFRPLLKMGEVLSFIECHYREPISIRQLTKIAGMSESTLMRTFQRVMKRSPIDHVIRVRVSRACDLLRQPEARVTEVAFETGFQDSNYFSRQFKKITGATPREFRARHNGTRRT